MVKPLLKWPGGKRWLAPKIVPFLENTYDRYLEPFLGGGAVLFALGPSKGIVSDTNSDLISCYQAVKENAEGVLFEYNKLKSNASEYYRIRDNWAPQSTSEKAARLIYLLHNSWNGLYRVNKEGLFNVPYRQRKRKNKLTKEVLTKIQSILSKVSIKCQNFDITISKARKGDLIFVDPPYFENGQNMFSKYSSISFRETEQERLAEALHRAEQRGAAWVLTNGYLNPILTHFPSYDVFRVPRHSIIAADPIRRRKIFEYVVLSRSEPLNALREFLTEHYKPVRR